MAGRTSFAALAAAVILAVPFAVVAGVAVLGGTGASAAPPAVAGGSLAAGSVPAADTALIEQAAGTCATVSAPLLAAQLAAESGFDPQAVSPAGAQGIAQFLPATWTAWAAPGASPFDPAAAIPAAARYDCNLADRMAQAQQTGTLPDTIPVAALMLAAYNAGPAAVIAAAGIPDNGQTGPYVQAILAATTGFTAPDDAGAAPAGTPAARIIAAARSQLGVPYAWGGGNYAGPTPGICTPGAARNDCHITGFDCSGLVLYAVYQASGGTIRLPHSADAQTRPASGGTPIPIADLQPGDIISFTNPGQTAAHHDGIYLGNDQLLDAPQSGTDIRIDNLNTPYYHAQQWRAIRYP